MLQTAIVANRTTEGEPTTAEIERLTQAAGARVVDTVTQRREKDPGTVFGTGKVAEIAGLVDERGADTVVVDEPLTPQQTVTLESRTGAAVVDRHRLVLEIFARQARSPRAQYQVELARLNYRLPRVRERTDEGALNRFTESGTVYYDLLDRIDELERKLGELPPVGQEFQDRREEGLDIVALVGYTNAGKSTLLRRLADDLELATETHGDIEEPATVEDQLFETLETTTRRATVQERPCLLTDTVGFLDDLPHWLVESFRGTLTAVEYADAALLVVDGSQPSSRLRTRIETVIDAVGTDHPPLVPVLNKTDLLDSKTVGERLTALEESLDDAVSGPVHQPISMSAVADEQLGELERALLDALPALEHRRCTIPLREENISVVSTLHDDAIHVETTYGDETITVEFAARPGTAAKLEARVNAADGRIE